MLNIHEGRSSDLFQHEFGLPIFIFRYPGKLCLYYQTPTFGKETGGQQWQGIIHVFYHNGRNSQQRVLLPNFPVQTGARHSLFQEKPL